MSRNRSLGLGLVFILLKAASFTSPAALNMSLAALISCVGVQVRWQFRTFTTETLAQPVSSD